MEIDAESKAIIDKYANSVPVPVISVATDLKLKVYLSDDFSPEESGSLVKEKDGFVIYVNKAHSPTRKRFTIAHEIAHYILHKNQFTAENIEHVDFTKSVVELKRDGKAKTGEEAKMETEANKLAAQILMPENQFNKVLAESSTIDEVAEKFEVSSSAASYRSNAVVNVKGIII